jgi:hypothetical protein
MDNENSHIIYRSRFEKDVDDFWHSETGTMIILVLMVIGLLCVLGAVANSAYGAFKNRRK